MTHENDDGFGLAMARAICRREGHEARTKSLTITVVDGRIEMSVGGAEPFVLAGASAHSLELLKRRLKVAHEVWRMKGTCRLVMSDIDDAAE